MAKIAFVSQPRDAVAATDAQTGSVTIVMWELAKRIAQRHDVVVFAPRAAGQSVEEVTSGLRIRRIPRTLRLFHRAIDLGTGVLNLRTPYFASPVFFREYAISIARWLERERPDIVHIQNCTQFLPLFHRAVPNARLFLHVHDEFLSLLPEHVVRPRAEKLSAVVTCSNFVTQCLQNRLPYLASRIHTVGNGVDTTYFNALEGAAEPDAFRILFVGRVSPEKGVHTLATAFSRLASTHPSAELHIAGPAGLLPLNQIRLLSGDPQVAALTRFYGSGIWDSIDKQLVHARTSYSRTIQDNIPKELHDRVHFHGPLSRDALRTTYQRAHVLAMPSVCREPFGLPLAEAMASGLPCVASRVGGMSDIVTDNLTGLLVTRGDLDALTHALQCLALDSNKRLQMGREARRRAEEHFDWSVAAARLESLYQQRMETPPLHDLQAARPYA